VPDEESDEPKRVAHCYMALSVVFDDIILFIPLPLVLFTWYFWWTMHIVEVLVSQFQICEVHNPLQHCAQW